MYFCGYDGSFSFTDSGSVLDNCYDIWQVMSMIPGYSQEFMPKGQEKESQAKIKKFMTMMDSMTDEGISCSLQPHNDNVFSLEADLFLCPFCIDW